MKYLLPVFLSAFLFTSSSAQSKVSRVYTSDIDNFWIAFDSIRTTTDSAKQLHYIQTLYIEKGTEGLKAFMTARDYSGPLWVQLIRDNPKFWAAIRPNTLSVKTKAAEIEKSIQKLRQLYPELQEAHMYFTIGGLRSGGTVMKDMVLIGTEIATGTKDIPASEPDIAWLAGIFQKQQPDNIVPLNIHEYIHTQQQGKAANLLAQCIKEGACDFLTELVMGQPLQTSYIQYGLEHEASLREKFKEEMFTTAYRNWLYNGSRTKTVGDLGYFMGYAICKAYFKQAIDKKKAIKEIIRLNFSDSNKVESFLNQSGYYPGTLDKDKLVQQFAARRPAVLKIQPFENGATDVDTAVKELTMVFSKPMNKSTYSFNRSKGGKAADPISGVKGFSDDGTAITVKLKTEPGHEYEFVVTDNSFASADGYPLVLFTVRFKTR